MNEHVIDIGIEKAWKLILDESDIDEIIVAHIDTGVDINHQDLKDNIWINKHEIPDNGIDDDGNVA